MLSDSIKYIFTSFWNDIIFFFFFRIKKALVKYKIWDMKSQKQDSFGAEWCGN